MRKTVLLILCLALVFALSGCGKDKPSVVEESVAGKVFVWEKEGFGSDFYIKLNADGTYEYYAGALSSYIGLGNWTVEKDTVVLTENKEMCGYDNVFRFAVKDGELVFLSEGSDKFMYVTVENGDRFLPDDDPDFVFDLK